MSLDAIRTVSAEAAAGKRVLVRADLNVPVKDGKVTDATRIERLAPTVALLRAAGAKTVLLSHFGRPKGGPAPEHSLAQVQPALERVLGCPVAVATDCIGAEAEAAVAALPAGGVLLMENLRFHKEEEANDRGFAEALAKLGDIYVNDAFSAAHRAHASTEGLAHLLPAYAGLSMAQELEALGRVLASPQRPVMAVAGGAKISTKLDLLQNLVGKVDVLVLGGGMANTFLLADGLDIGKSLAEREMLDSVARIRAAAAESGCRLILPSDAVVAPEFKEGAPDETVPVDAVPADRMILDVGPKSLVEIRQAMAGVKTLLMNGPLGAFEIKPFDQGTVALARAIAERTAEGMVSVAGGGDTVAALAHAGVEDKLTYVSTAGGAFLEWLEGKELPGVKALQTAAG